MSRKIWMSMVCLSLTASATLASRIPAPPVTRPADAEKYLEQHADVAEFLVGDKAARQWWVDARFGVFMHWNPPASMSSQSMSWGRQGMRPRHSTKERTKGGLPAAEYDQLYKQFNPVKFNADRWVKMIKDAGAGYFVLTSKHHDGFVMFDSKYTEYDIMSTPFKRDVCRELAEACERHGIKMMFYYSQPDWTHPDFPENHEAYNEYLYNQIEELLELPSVAGIWFDGLGKHPDTWNAPELIKMIRTKRPGILINPRFAGQKWRFGDFDTPEQEIGAFQIDRPWETCLTMGQFWSYTDDPNGRVLPFEVCMRSLIRCAGGDGNLLLNVGPSPEGTIRQEEIDNYLQMGDWLKKYGESIYKTRGGPYEPGIWGSSTRNAKAIYLHILQMWPTGVLELPDPGVKIKSASLLTGGKVRFEQKGGSLHLFIDPKNHNPMDTLVKLITAKNPLDLEVVPTAPTVTSLTKQEGVTITASSSLATSPPDKLVGHHEEFRAGKHHKSAWKPDYGDKTPWLEVDFGTPKTFDRILVEESLGWTDLSDGVAFQVQDKQGKWKTLCQRANYSGYATAQFEPVTAQKLRAQFKARTKQMGIITFNVYGEEK
jgi:alpha-L-fucosidase